MTILPNQLAVLNLIACDYSYNPNQVVGDPLSTFRDSGTSNEYLPPDHLFNRVGLGAGSGPVGRFRSEIILPDWEVQSWHLDPDTGFAFVIFQNAAKSDVIVAMTGTNGLNAQDWYSNINLGKTQWEKNVGDVRALLNQLTNADGTPFTGSLNFTGQSLGGGLAQYALYDFKSNPENIQIDPASVTLTTYNAFGGLDGLPTYRGQLQFPF